MNLVLLIAAGLLTIAAGLLLVRLTVGPTILDRSMALDVMMSVLVCGIVLLAAREESAVGLPAILCLAAVGFVGAVAVARYASGVDDVEAERDQADDGEEG